MLKRIWNKLEQWHDRFKRWKPIHLCWWFEKYGLPIPPYLIGGLPNLDGPYWKIGDNDNANPDLCSFDALNTPRTSQAKQTAFMIRPQVTENAGNNTANAYWQLYYNNTNNSGTAVEVGSPLSGTTYATGATGLPTDGTELADSTVVFDNSGSYTWSAGDYEESGQTGNKHLLLADGYSDFQFCLQFTADAVPGQTYYFWLFYEDGALNSYSGGPAEVTVETNQKTSTFIDNLIVFASK